MNRLMFILVSFLTFVIPANRLFRNVIARACSDRSNLISCRIPEIAATPEKRLVMTKDNYDKVWKARIRTLLNRFPARAPFMVFAGKTVENEKNSAMRAIMKPSSIIGIAVMLIGLSFAGVQAEENPGAFEIKTFEISGNSLYPAEKLLETVQSFAGENKTAADVEKARDTLEKFYHESGYPAVLVNIPEQTVQEGVVKLHVIESRVGRVKVSGNRYFTSEKLLRDIESFNPGQMLYLPKVQRELGRVNRHADIKVSPVMTPGRAPGTIDIELKVEDQLPLHGSLELNNKAGHDTTELRLNGMLRYDNLWQREHSLALQYQTAPLDFSELQVLSGAYMMAAPWEEDHQWVLYGVWTDSKTVIEGKTEFGGFQVAGKGLIVGTRYVVPLPPYKLYAHNLTLGASYSDFAESVGYENPATGENTYTPIRYMPFSLGYDAVLQDPWGGMTQFHAGLNLSFRGLVSDQHEFELKRFKGNAGYLYVRAGAERNQKLPWGMGLLMKLEGQLSDSPLISNEQYQAGGMDSVRGYKEGEAAGDDAVYARLELTFPDPLEKFGGLKRMQMNPFVFYDYAYLSIKDPLPAQAQSTRLEGTGVGLRGSITKYLEYELDWGLSLNDTDKIEKYCSSVYFKIKGVF